MGWLHNIRIVVISFAAVLLIVMAVSFSVMRALLPHATGYLEEVKQEISSAIGLPISIRSIDADMDWLSPRLKILDLVVYKKNGKDELIHLEEANFSLAYIESIRNQKPTIGSIELVGAEIVIERYKNNRWVVQGIELSGEKNRKNIETTQLIQTLKNINYSVLDSHIHWNDYTNKTDSLELKDVNAKVESFFGTRNVDVRFRLPKKYGKDLRVTAEFEGDVLKPEELKGKIYFSGKKINVSAWLHKLNLETKISGEVDASLWVDFDREVIRRVTGEVAYSDLDILHKKDGKPGWAAQQVDLRFLYRKLSNGWRVDVADLYLIKDDVHWDQPSKLVIVNKPEIETRVSSNYIRLQDILPLADMFTQYTDQETYKKIGLSEIKGDVYNLDARIYKNTKNRNIKAEFENLELTINQKDYIFTGLDGGVDLHDDEMRIDIHSEHVELQLADMFRNSIELDHLSGSIDILMNDDSFSIKSDYIAAGNKDLDMVTRIDFVRNLKQPEKSDLLDMQIDFFDADASKLSRYYPVTLLSKELVGWLDTGIVTAKVDSGSFVFRGEVDDFPFPNNTGVMEVDFAVNDLNLHYLDGWPNIDRIDADLRFYNESLTVSDVTGYVAKTQIKNLQAKIPDLNAPVLFVSGNTKTDARELQKFVWNSGLDDIIGDALRDFTIVGDTDFEFDLTMDLDDTDNVKTNGKLSFADALLEYPTMKYVLTDINGSLSYTESGMSAENIHAKFAGSDIKIDARPIRDKKKNESVFYISGDIDIDALLNKFDWVPEGWVEGTSDWKVDVHIPYTGEEYLVRIDANSKLENVVLSVSDGVQKKVKSDLPVEMEIFVLEDDLLVNAKSTDIFEVIAKRDADNYWEVDVDSLWMKGVTRFDNDLDTSTTIHIEFDELDLDAFASRKIQTGNDTLNPSIIPAVEATVKKLHWDDWHFTDVKVSTGWHPQGMVVNSFVLQGPSSSVNGHGSWLYTWPGKHETSLKITATSSDLGHTLKEMGIFKELKSTTMTSVSDWYWDAAPYQFSWEGIEGSSNFHLKNGEMKDIDPGAGGRMVGLLNVLHLPKRLILDFEDVSAEGFVFDDVKADFKLKNGNAKSDFIDIRASVANMKMFGRIGMEQRDYDLGVIVKPHSSAATFTGGAIAGGPVLGAGLVLIQKLFGIEQASHDEYTIIGPWENPAIKQVSKRAEATEE